MKKSELFTKYWFFKEDIIPIDHTEFCEILEDKDNAHNIHHDVLMRDTDCVRVSTDGTDYYAITSQWFGAASVLTDRDSYYFKVKTPTKAQREEFLITFIPEFTP